MNTRSKQPLSSSDAIILNKEKKQYLYMLASILSVTGLVVLALSSLIPFQTSMIMLVIFWGVTIQIVFLIFKFGKAKDQITDLKEGYKIVLSGHLQNKIQEECRSATTNSPLGNHYYFFKLGSEQIQVTWDLYYNFQEAEKIEIHMAPRSKKILLAKRLGAEPAKKQISLFQDKMTNHEKIGLGFKLLFGLFIAAIFESIIGYLSYNFYPDYTFTSAIFGLMFIIIAGFSSYYIFMVMKTILKGKKEIISGSLEGKEWIHDKYYLILNNKKWDVGSMDFKKRTIGERIEIHLVPGLKEIISIKCPDTI
jgi:hypothetical protein